MTGSSSYTTNIRRLIELIFIQSQHENMVWEVSPLPDSYFVSFPQKSLRISKSGDDFKLTIFNKYGEPEDEFVEDDIINKLGAIPVVNGKLEGDYLGRLYGLAKRKAGNLATA